MKAIYLRGNLRNPKCSDPVLAVQLSFLCTAWEASQTQVSAPGCPLAVEFGIPKCSHVAHSEKTTPCTQDSLNLCKKTCHQEQEGSICSLYVQPEIFFHECHSSTCLLSKNKSLQYYHVVTSKASSPSNSHFRCEKRDEKLRPSFCVLFALQSKPVKMLWFSPCWTLTQKIQLNQQLSSLVSPCEFFLSFSWPMNEINVFWYKYLVFPCTTGHELLCQKQSNWTG